MARTLTEEEWYALPISNDFMFSKVMRDESLCKEVVELLIGKKVGEVKDFQEEKTINITHDSKTVRLDVYLRDEDKAVNVEMQVSNEDDLRKRSRYYQDLIDLGLLESGHKYSKLPTSYVIFICTFDLIGNGKAKNSYQNLNDETFTPLGDGTHKIFYNTKASDTEENPQLKAFLKYVGGELTDDTLIQKLEQRLKQVKSNVEWRKEYMKFEADQQIREDKVRKENSLEIARNLLDVLENSVIALKTGLPVSEVEKLRANS
ncbi:MAG: Rpn family recombination-promoting nuclease/putative transposase [Eubacteriales bacterium]